LPVRRLCLWYRFRLKHRCLLWSFWPVLFLVCARWIVGFTSPGSLCVQAILILDLRFSAWMGHTIFWQACSLADRIFAWFFWFIDSFPFLAPLPARHLLTVLSLIVLLMVHIARR
jgi:hypothetical protein